MAYTEQQLTLLTCLHGMIENDPPRSGGEFARIFQNLRDPCGVGYDHVAPHLGRAASELRAWAEGSRLPERSEWSYLFAKTKDFIEDELRIHRP